MIQNDPASYLRRGDIMRRDIPLLVSAAPALMARPSARDFSTATIDTRLYVDFSTSR